MRGSGACVAGGRAWQGGMCVARMLPGRYYKIQSMSGRYTSIIVVMVSTSRI